MSRIRGRDTRPELVVRSVLHRLGLRFTVNGPMNRSLPGRPDIVLPRLRTVVFVHGCFWHRHRGCSNCTVPSTHRSFWVKKLAGNAARDARNAIRLRGLRWKRIVVWECQTEDRARLTKRLAAVFRR